MPLFSAERQAAKVEEGARDVTRQGAPWIQRLARLGYAAKGVVYVIIGGIAAQAAFGDGGEQPGGSRDALLAILGQPFGKVLLGIVALGLLGYVLWRLVQAIADPERKGRGGKGLLQRAGFLLSALFYAALALEAVRLIRGSGGGSGGNGAEHWTARAMAWPAGRWIVMAVGAGIVAFGLYELYRAFKSDIAKNLGVMEMPVAARRRVELGGRFGLAARSVVSLILGWFVVQAALRYDPQRAQDLEEALGTLRDQPYGPWLLGTVAVGLIAYGLFEFVKARYRIIRPA